MKTNKKISIFNFAFYRIYLLSQKTRLIRIFLLGIILLPIKVAKSEEIFLKCTGKFEINRGELIKPDWETSYLTINLDGFESFIEDKGIQTKGSTLIRRNSYTIIHKDNNKRIKAKYKIHGTYGNYVVDYPQRNRTLIGSCQKSRG